MKNTSYKFKEASEFLANRERQGLLRTLTPIKLRREGRLYCNAKEYIDFSSNDYLGFSEHPRLIAEAKKALDIFGTASSASRLMSGDLEIHHRLEEKVAQFKHKESALIFNSGYQANLGIISSLYGRGDCIFSDRLNHASIVDGILLSGARFFRFQHNDVNHLQLLLRKERKKFNHALIITETIFSMDGDRPHLKDLVELKEKYDCELMVDEAHATGIYGESGSGVVEEEGLSERIELVMGTFSKALGSFGAYLATSRKMVQYLINTCRSFIYSTALPPQVVACNLASIDLVKEEPKRRHKLLRLSNFLRKTLKDRGLKVRGASQIIPLIVGDNLKTIVLAKRLQEKGFWVLAIRPPTVPQKEARLRFSLTTYHTKEILQRLIDEICNIGI
jgi:8-amino-7-oxononanoate synthase